MSALRVRAVRVAEHRALGWVVALAGGIATAVMLISYSPSDFAHPFEVLGLCIAAWAAGPLAVWRRRARVQTITLEPGMVRVGGEVFGEGEAAASVAHAARGVSVALSEGRHSVFLEVERKEDARRILAALDMPWPGRGAVRVSARRDLVRIGTRVLAAVGVVIPVLYALLAGFVVDPPKGVLAVAFCCALAASLSHVLDPLLRRRVRWTAEEAPSFHDTLGVGGRLGDHLALHLASRLEEPAAPTDASAEAASTGAASAEAASAGAAGDARVRVLTRGDGEATLAWLRRVDGIGATGSGYRSDAPSREELGRILHDDDAPVDARVAAARLLTRRHDERPDALARDIEPELRVRIEAALDDDESAAANLDDLGPRFRAR